MAETSTGTNTETTEKVHSKKVRFAEEKSGKWTISQKTH